MSTKQLRNNSGKRLTYRRPSRVSVKKIENIDGEPEIRFRHIDKADAKKEIQDYLNKHPQGSRTSKIIETLRIDPLLTSDILEELKQEGAAFSKPIE
ncbi:MAG TPA: hypothetical protein VH500_02610 [Nitrososphaeraceae archaeon]|jgi:hypothetical protein